MDYTKNNFKNYLNFFGILNKNESDSFITNSNVSNNENLILLLGKILKIKYKKNDINKIIILSNNILNHYVNYDNEKLLTTIKKLLIIYSKFIKEKKRYYLYIWIIKKTKFKLLNSKKISKKSLKLTTKLTNKKYQNKRTNSTLNIYSIAKSNEFTIICNKEIDRKNSSKIKIKNNGMNDSNDNNSLNYYNKKKTPNSTRQLMFKKLINKISDNSKEKNHENKNNNIITHKKVINKYKYFTELSNSNIEREKKINEMRKKINKKFDDIYTFTPIKFTKNNKNKYKSLSQPFYERLENDIRKRKININKLENEIFEKEKTKNNISKNYKSHSADNEKNIENYIRKKKEKINKIKDKIEKKKEITFKPHLNNEYNDKIIKEPFEIRYNICIKNRENETNLNKINSLNNIDKECTFAPKINNKYDFVENFSERQNYFYHKKNKHIEEIKNKNKIICSFQPEISKNSKDLLIKKNVLKLIKNKNDDYVKKLTFGLNSAKTRSANDLFDENNQKKISNKGRNFLFENSSLNEVNEVLFKRIKKEKDEESLKENFTDKRINKYSTTDKSNELSQLRLYDDDNFENDFQMRMKKIVNENYEKEKIRQQRYYYLKNKIINNFYQDSKFYEIDDN